MALQQYQRIELGFDLDDFNKPISYSGIDAWVHQIMQLCMLDPGSIPSNPTIGIGITRYEFLLEDDRRKLCNEINRQVPLFYPDMPFTEVTVEVSQESSDVLYLVTSFTYDGSVETAVVAVKKGYKYIDFAIAM